MVENLSRQTPLAFFLEALAKALQVEGIRVSESVHIYVAHVLERQVAHGWLPADPLSYHLHQALSTSQQFQREQALRQVGERALVSSGLWWRYQYRPLRPSHTQFHMDMGKLAYRQLPGQMFTEVSEKFTALVDALIRMGTESSLNPARDIMTLYRLWCETHSRHAARGLASHGIVVDSKIPS